MRTSLKVLAWTGKRSRDYLELSLRRRGLDCQRAEGHRVHAGVRGGGDNSVSTIDPKLFERLHKQLGLSQVSIYRRIEGIVNTLHLERRLAAIVLASQSGLNISRFATSEDLAAIRQATSPGAATKVSPLEIPSRPAVAPSRVTRRAVRSVARRQRGTVVWVVHGRNQQAANAIRAFLRALGLQPLEWNEAVGRARHGSPYVGEVLERAFRDAAAVVVLLTPDDEARLRAPYRTGGDPSYETRLTGQPRPNVLFEAGMAFGRKPESTVLVQLGTVRSFSNVAGRHVVQLDNSSERRHELATRLANAGCDVNMAGLDWLSAGDFRLVTERNARRRGSGQRRRR